MTRPFLNVQVADMQSNDGTTTRRANRFTLGPLGGRIAGGFSGAVQAFPRLFNPDAPRPTAPFGDETPEPVFLSDYIDKAGSEPWAWGGVGGLDCCFFAGNWIRAATGRDPLGPYRGTYSDARGAGRLIKRRGGLLAMVGAEMDRCGFSRTSTPEHGDIGIVEMNAEWLDIEARTSVVIMNGSWWVGKTRDGYACVQCEPLAAWRVL